MAKTDLNGYELSRNFFDWCFENPEKIKPIHIAVYFFAIEHCNRLGWKPKFGFPSQMAMDAIGVKSWHTYINAFNDLVDWEFFILIERSKNQYSSNIIALIKNNKANIKALDKAFTKHSSKHQRSTYQSTYQSIDSINKQYNKETIKPENEEQKFSLKYDEYKKHLLTQSVLERLSMNVPVAINAEHARMVMNEFLETCYADIVDKENKFKVEQYFIAWVKKENKVNDAIKQQKLKQNVRNNNTTASNRD